MPTREQIIADISEAVMNGARKSVACSSIDMQIRTMERWQHNKTGDKRSIIVKKPVNKLTDSERSRIIEICCSDEYKDMTPNEIVPKMAEKGLYIASEASFYRILKNHKMVHSKKRKSSRRKKPAALIAMGPNEVWSWDITYLRSPIKGLYYYLYLFTDIWSRKIVGWEIHQSESSEIAADLMKRLCREQNIKHVKLHSDNGSPMKGATMLATLQRLGVIASFSRPGVSNDNPFSESLFKTLKYHPAYPQQFSSIEDAREWVTIFVEWYNNVHMHSGIKYVTPLQRHLGFDIEILVARKETYKKAKQKNPIRWSGAIRNWNWQEKVILNPANENLIMDKVA